MSDEETLDPQDWAAVNRLAHRMVDDVFAYLRDVGERPVWRPLPPSVRQRFSGPVPQQSEGEEQAYRDFSEYVFPYPLGNIHPRFWGWVNGTGTLIGVLSDMLAATMNPNDCGFDQTAPLVDLQVIDWCKEMLGFYRKASGHLVSGGSEANLIGLAVARNARATFDARKLGMAGAPQLMTLYCSTETHYSAQKAVELLGMGSDSLRRIPVDSEFRIDLPALRDAIQRDLDLGHKPFCIIGNAGTVNTGAIDPLDDLSEICKKHDLWFHVDGAFGAMAALTPALRPLIRGMEYADSLAFDLHKWMYVPYDIGCILVRDSAAHRNTFAMTTEYLTRIERGVSAPGSYLSDYGFQLSRGFRALKAWMSIKTYGVEKLARMVEKNVQQAHVLAQRITENPELELLAPVPLNIVCFRPSPDGLSQAEINDLTKELLMQIHESGVAVPSYTTLKGQFAIRVSITNHRTQLRDIDLFLTEVIKRTRIIKENIRRHYERNSATVHGTDSR